MKEHFGFIGSRVTRPLKWVSLILVIPALSACAKVQSGFDCPFGKGVGCRSITQVNQMVDDEKFDELKIAKGKHKTLAVKKDDRGESVSLAQTKIQRMQEEHLTVWIAPFEDERGNFHEDSVIHTVIKPGAWGRVKGG